MFTFSVDTGLPGFRVSEPDDPDAKGTFTLDQPAPF